MSTATPLSSTDRTRLSRMKERGQSDRATLYQVLDSEFICHLGVVVDGSPMVVPTGYGRIDDTLYLHGSTGAKSLRATDACVTVTHVEGIVMARSVFHHSINYRSAVIYGELRTVTDPDEKLAGLAAIVENLAPGQWEAARSPNRKELAATSVVALPLAEASVKVREGGPGDEEEDYALDIWAGVLPVRRVFGETIDDPVLRPGIKVPEHVRDRR